jgi:hypothetical protein
MLRRLLVLIAAAALLTWLYLVAYVYVNAFVSSYPMPMWWLRVFAAECTAALTWYVLSHAATMLLLSIPFAFIINWLYPRFGVALAAGLTLVVWVAIEPLSFLFHAFEAAAPYIRGVYVVDHLIFLPALPGLVWLSRHLPSNQRLERP